MKYSLTVLALLSLGLGTFWFSSVLLDTRQPITVPYVILGAVPTLAGLTTLAVNSWRRGWAVPLSLSSGRVSSRLVSLTLGATIASYLLLVPVFWFLGRLAVGFGANPADPEGLIFAALTGLWMPLWWAPLPGAVLAWWWSQRHQRHQN